jgi:hypothetical protein
VSTVVAIVSGPFFAACGLLIVTGVAKVRQPHATNVATNAALGVAIGSAGARALGAMEIVLALAALAIGGPTAFAVALLFAAFAFTALRLRQRAPNTACGCIGDRSGNVGVAHVASSAAAVVAALIYAIGDGGGIVSVLGDQPFGGAPYLALTACCVALVALFLTDPSEERTWLH